MGGFILVQHNNVSKEDLHVEYKNALSIFERRGQAINKEIHTDSAWLILFDFHNKKTEPTPTENKNEFFAFCGTCFYKGLFGNKAAQAIFNDYKSNDIDYSLIEGSYVIILRDKDKLILFNDLIGNFRVYKEITGKIYSSSFLAIETTIKTKTISSQEIYEYIFNGAFYGNKTIYNEIELLDSNFIWQLKPESKKTSRQRPSAASIKGLTFEQKIEVVTNNLVDYFERIHNTFGDSVTSALSGGYDSRLMLGLMRNIGIKPKLYVYGTQNSSDVQIARLIAEGEDLELDWIDKTLTPKVDLDQYKELLTSNYLFLDGFYNVGVFDDGSEIETRIKRTANTELQINGGGGEIYRNFWMLPDRSYSPEEFLRSKYDFIDYKRLTTAAFEKDKYFSLLSEKVKSCISDSTDRLNRQQIELLYPLFRLKYWMGLNNSVNNQLAFTLTPFSEARFIFQSLDVPIKDKNLGVFEGKLIQKVDPKLSGYTSGYGYPFNSDASMAAKMKNSMILHMPTGIKPIMRRLKKTKEKKSMPYFLTGDYLKLIFNSPELEIERYINISEIEDPDILSRSLTIELHLTGNIN